MLNALGGILLLIGVVDVGKMNVLVEHGRGKAAKRRGNEVDPQESCVDTALLTLSCNVENLVDGVHKTEGRVEAAT